MLIFIKFQFNSSSKITIFNGTWQYKYVKHLLNSVNKMGFSETTNLANSCTALYIFFQ